MTSRRAALQLAGSALVTAALGTPQAVAQRARIVLMTAEGVSPGAVRQTHVEVQAATDRITKWPGHKSGIDAA